LANFPLIPSQRLCKGDEGTSGVVTPRMSSSWQDSGYTGGKRWRKKEDRKSYRKKILDEADPQETKTISNF